MFFVLHTECNLISSHFMLCSSGFFFCEFVQFSFSLFSLFNFLFVYFCSCEKQIFNKIEKPFAFSIGVTMVCFVLFASKRNSVNMKHTSASLIVIFPLDYRNQDEINNENTFRTIKRKWTNQIKENREKGEKGKEKAEKRDQMVSIWNATRVPFLTIACLAKISVWFICHILCSILFTPKTVFFVVKYKGTESKKNPNRKQQNKIQENKKKREKNNNSRAAAKKKMWKKVLFMWIPIGRKSFICETKKRTQEENKKLNKTVKCVQLPNFRSLLVRYGRLRNAYIK